MEFTKHEKDMIIIALRNEGKRFQKFVDELKRGYPYMEGATKQMVKEEIIECVEVVQEYEKLMMKISSDLLTAEE